MMFGIAHARRDGGWRDGGRRIVLAAALFVLSLALPPVTSPVFAQAGCQTPFLVHTDPYNPGVTMASGDVSVTRDGVLLGKYGGDGRFAGYAIRGTLGTILNTATGMARVQGELVATSPDGGSSITVWLTGQVDFGAAVATGNFTAGNGTGNDAGYRAFGTIAGTVVGPATLEGVDIGLC
jgi:hypothetical protein